MSGIEYAKLTDAELANIIEAFFQGRGSTLHEPFMTEELGKLIHAINDAATRKTWWMMVQMLGTVKPLKVLINSQPVELADYLADLARAAGWEPWNWRK